MILSMSGQTVQFLTTIVLGGIVGFLFDIFRIIRKAFKHMNIFTQLEDVLYWLISTVVIFYYMLNTYDGNIRLFSIAGIFLGMVLYFSTVSVVLLKASFAIIDFIKKILSFLVRLILYPIEKLLELLKIPFIFAKNVIKRLFYPAKKALLFSTRYVKLKGREMINQRKSEHNDVKPESKTTSKRKAKKKAKLQI